MNKYRLFKGELVKAAPFRPAYKGSPHYVINVRGLQSEIFKYVVNAASDEVGQDGNTMPLGAVIAVDNAFIKTEKAAPGTPGQRWLQSRPHRRPNPQQSRPTV